MKFSMQSIILYEEYNCMFLFFNGTLELYEESIVFVDSRILYEKQNFVGRVEIRMRHIRRFYVGVRFALQRTFRIQTQIAHTGVYFAYKRIFFIQRSFSNKCICSILMYIFHTVGDFSYKSSARTDIYIYIISIQRTIFHTDVCVSYARAFVIQASIYHTNVDCPYKITFSHRTISL